MVLRMDSAKRIISIAWRIRGWLVSCALVVIGSCCVAFLVSLVLMKQDPGWWARLTLDEAGTIERAGLLHNAFATRLHELKETDTVVDDDWRSVEDRFFIKADDANAWLNIEMPRWLANMDEDVHWPAVFRELQVSFENDEIRVGIRLLAGRREQVVWLTLTPVLREDGSLWLPAKRIHVGRMPLPVSWVLSEAELRADSYIPAEFRDLPETAAMFRVFAGQQPVAEEATVRLMDGRRVRLLSLVPRGGRLEVAVRQERELATR